jgi:phosphatidylinositol alpha-mannosyltransferase
MKPCILKVLTDMADNNPSQLKIGLILDTSLDSTDGVPQYVIQLGKWLTSQGHKVHYLVGQSQRQDVPNVHSMAKNIKVNFNGNRTTIPLFVSRRKIKRFMNQHNFDVLHVQTPHHPLMAQPIILAAAPPTAIVGTFHVLPYGIFARVGTGLLGIWLRPSLKRFNTMMAVSSVAADFCSQSFGLSAQVVPNMVDYKHYHDAKALSKYDDNVPTILFLGRLVERKGCLTLLKAVVELRKEPTVPDFRLLICGRGHLEAKLRQFVVDNNLEPIVEFAGFISEEDKPRYYASADLAVFPSSSGESFGIVLLEAMASGKAAVLAGDNPGYRSVMSVCPELLFEPQNSLALAQKIRLYLENKALHDEAAAWGGDYAKNFDIEVVGQKILTVYRQALRKSRRQ